MVYVTCGGVRSYNPTRKVFIHIDDKQLRRSLTKQRGMRECMFCVLLISVLLIACLLSVVASSAFDSKPMVAEDGMGIAPNDDEHTIAKKLILMNALKRGIVQPKDKHRDMVEVIAHVESMLIPFETEEQQNPSIPESPQIMIMRNLRLQLQMPNGVDSSIPKLDTGLGAENSDWKGLDVTGEFSKREIDSELMDGFQKVNNGIFDESPHTIGDNKDSNFQNNFRILFLNAKVPDLSSNLSGNSSYQQERSNVSREKDTKKAFRILEHSMNNFDKFRPAFFMAPAMFNSRIPEDVEDSNSKGNNSEESSGKDPSAPFVRGSLLNIPIKDNIRDQRETDDDERKVILLTPIRQGAGSNQPFSFAWRRPLTLATLSVCALVLLALLASTRMRRKTRRNGRRGHRRSVDDDDEMLVPEVMKHSIPVAESVSASAPRTPLWAQYLGRASSPHPVATHAPRSAVRMMRDALRAYGQRQRSRSHRHHHHPASAVIAGAAPGANVPLADDGPVPDVPLGALHV